jgi:hypothetical protein
MLVTGPLLGIRKSFMDYFSPAVLLPFWVFLRIEFAPDDDYDD